jgi:hypothetical protein
VREVRRISKRAWTYFSSYLPEEGTVPGRCMHGWDPTSKGVDAEGDFIMISIIQSVYRVLSAERYAKPATANEYTPRLAIEAPRIR